jgi:hypothetical protein
MATYKLDIFDLLGKINSVKSGDIYSKLSDDEKKGFAPLIVMRWLSGTSDERQIILLNEFVNKYVFTLGKHPHLLMQLMQVASSKTSKRYQWIGVKSNKKNNNSRKVVQEYFEMSAREVNLMNPFPCEAEIMQMADELGWQADEIKLLKQEYKACKE